MYFVAEDKQGKIHALVVMAQLSTQYGCQVKWALDFPGAAGGAIETLITFAIKSVTEAGEKSVTFGTSAVNHLHPGHNLDGFRIRALSRTYKELSEALHLAQKGEFRQKLGAQDDAVWVCYPKGTLGSRGVRAIVDFFED
jgi:aspartyl-tRNA synthetase